MKKILVIDDEVDFSRLLKMNLELMGGFEVATAVNGEEGIKLAQNLKPDLILLDILMPGIDGFEVLKRLKKDRNTIEIPVIVLSAKINSVSKVQAKELHGGEFISKPVEISDLKAKIIEVLKRRYPEGAKRDG